MSQFLEGWLDDALRFFFKKETQGHTSDVQFAQNLNALNFSLISHFNSKLGRAMSNFYVVFLCRFYLIFLLGIRQTYVRQQVKHCDRK